MATYRCYHRFDPPDPADLRTPGEYQGYFANLNALTVAVGPGIYGYIYAAGRPSRGR